MVTLSGLAQQAHPILTLP
jgi:ankyrin repeat protein